MSLPATSRRATTIRQTLAGPIAILITIPALVLVVGAFITWNTWVHSQNVVREMLRSQFDETALRVQSELAEVMAQGEAALIAVRHQLDREPIATNAPAFALVLRDQFAARPALAYMGYGTESGNFYGISRADPALPPFFTTRLRSDPTAATCVLQDYQFTEGGLRPTRQDPKYGYDPRLRPWYREAIAAGQRIVTAPYVWFDSGVVGVTVAEPYTAADGQQGVVQIEFNVNSLSRVVETLGARNDVSLVIHTDDGEVLAMPGLRQRQGMDEAGQGRVTRFEHVERPEIRAYAKELPSKQHAEKDQWLMDIDAQRHLVSTRELHLPGGRRWQIACIGNLDKRLASARKERTEAMIAVAVALVVACILAALFARNIVNTHLRARRAEAEAAKARDAVRQIGAYHLYRILGQGGMGEVWLAEHGLLARPVAVKLIQSEYFGEISDQEREIAIARFEREARTLAQLQSPHTITLYDFGVSDDGDLFYAMELLDGMDLYELVGNYGPQPLGRVVDILIQSARSLGEAHGRGLVHRDIKPANIYLCRQADVLDMTKVLDFGMVRRVKEAEDPRLTIAGTVEGTPPYMAPEQIRDRDDADGRIDLYALALVGYYLLSGHEPMMRKTPVKTLQAHLEADPPRASEVALQQIPEPLDDLLLACLAKDPDKRPPSMAVFIEMLEAIPIPPDRRWARARSEAWWDAVPRPDLSFGSGERKSAKDLHKRKRR